MVLSKYYLVRSEVHSCVVGYNRKQKYLLKVVLARLCGCGHDLDKKNDKHVQATYIGPLGFVLALPWKVVFRLN